MALLVLVLAIALVIWGITSLFGAIFGGKSEPNDTAPAAPATQTEAASTPKPSASKPTTPTPTEPPEPEPCDPLDIMLTARTDAQSYAGDKKPRLSFAIENTGSEACTLNVGTAAQEFRIDSGSDEIWVSTHCQKDPTDQVVLLKPGRAFTSPEFEWVRERSAPDTCDGERPAAVAGGSYYQLTVVVDDIASQPTTFVLE